MPRNIQRPRRSKSALVMVDIQEKLLPAMTNPGSVVENVERLAKAAEILQVPVVLTEQYPKGLGPTVGRLQAAVRTPRIEKVAFSCCGEPKFLEAITAGGFADIILCGLESHVCVTQTCLDLLERGFNVFVVADAVSSRTPENLRMGLDRMAAAGAVLVSTEMVLFELLERAGTPEFKQIQSLLK